MGLLPDTLNCKWAMRRECRERFPPPPTLNRCAGKTFPAFPAHAHPQFYVSGKRPMVLLFGTIGQRRSAALTVSRVYKIRFDIGKLAHADKLCEKYCLYLHGQWQWSSLFLKRSRWIQTCYSQTKRQSERHCENSYENKVVERCF